MKNVAKDEPKIEGLSFNIFAIGALLVLLPISTAFVTNLSQSDTYEYESVNEAWQANTGGLVYEYCPPAFENFMLSYIDKGLNATQFYKDAMPGQDDDGLRSLWDDSNYFYQYMLIECMNSNETLGGVFNDNNGNPVYGFPTPNNARNSDIFFEGFDIHAWAEIESTIDGFSWPGYIQEIGNDFSLKIHENYFKYLTAGESINSLRLTFIDHDYSFNCDSPIFQEITYKADIEFFLENNSLIKYKNFEFERMNKYEVRFMPNTNYFANGTAMTESNANICHPSFVLEFKLDPFQSIELNDMIMDRYDKLSAVIDVKDLDYDVITDPSLNLQAQGQGHSQIKPPIPILDDGGHSTLLEVSYISETTANFFLRGGAFVLGIGLFLLAIASTPYWNPVVDTFKGMGGNQK